MTNKLLLNISIGLLVYQTLLAPKEHSSSVTLVSSRIAWEIPLFSLSLIINTKIKKTKNYKFINHDLRTKLRIRESNELRWF